MKKLLAIIVLSLCFIIPSQADDIRDFQIEGVSVGDSVLDHPIFKNSKKGILPYKNQKYSASFVKLKTGTYDEIRINYLKKDKKKIIETISGNKFYDNNIGECLKEKKIIENELSNLYQNLKSRSEKKVILQIQAKKVCLIFLNLIFQKDT